MEKGRSTDTDTDKVQVSDRDFLKTVGRQYLEDWSKEKAKEKVTEVVRGKE